MSNQFGLMLSLLFLFYAIIFSGELISYQESNAKFLANVNQIAHHLQIYGNEENYLEEMKSNYNLKEISCSENDNCLYLECYKEYKSLTSLCSFLDTDFKCTLYIYL